MKIRIILGVLAALAFACPAHADTKISGFPSGGALQSGDLIPIVRGGVNYGATYSASASGVATFNTRSGAVTFTAPDAGSVLQIAPITHQFLTGLNASGVFSQAQPAFSDISGVATLSQLGTSYTNGQLLIGNTSTGLLSTATLTAGSNITITNGPGTITIASTGGGSMVYPGAGIPLSTGSAWGTSYSTSGTGNVALTTSPVFTTPNIGIATGNITGNAATVTTNANLTGDVTSAGNATTLAAATVTGKALTGFVAGAGSVTASDTILTAFNKVVGNINGLTTGVSTVFGRAGAVTAQSGDYGVAQVTGAAPLASPTFTGTVTLPAGQAVNGVTLTTGGSSSTFLNGAGAYTTPAGGSSVSITAGSSALVVSPSPLTGTGTIDIGASVATSAKNLGFFAATTSAQLAGVLSDETGSGAAVFGTSPTISGASLTGTTAIGTSTFSQFPTITPASVAGVITNNSSGVLASSAIIPVANGGTGSSNTGSAAIQNILGGTAQLPHWNKALAKVLAGKGNARILCLGDSVTEGYYSTNSAANTAMADLGFCGQLAHMFNAAGVYASNENFIGDAASDRNTLVPFMTLGSGWSGTSAGLGGTILYNNNNASTSSFKASIPVDTFVLWYPTLPGAGVLAYNIDGGANTTINENVANSFSSVTIPAGSLGIHTLNLLRNSGTNIFVTGVEAYDSTKSMVLIDNGGWSGAKTSDWASTTTSYSPAPACGTFAPDLVIVALQINDEINSIPLATYTANLQTIITNCQSSGVTDVLMMTSSHTNPADGTNPTSEATQATYAAAIRSVASTAANSSFVTGVPVVDVFADFFSYALQNSSPSMVYSPGSYPLDLHPNYYGHGIMAKDIMSVIMPYGNAFTPHYQGIISNTITTSGYTVSTLPTGRIGMKAYVTDQTTSCPAAGAALTGSGAVTCPVFYNGSAWVGD